MRTEFVELLQNKLEDLKELPDTLPSAVYEKDKGTKDKGTKVLRLRVAHDLIKDYSPYDSNKGDLT